jgi:hypothetical protein
MKKSKKIRCEDNARCIGFGKCMSMHVETIVEDTETMNFVNIEKAIKNGGSNISSITEEETSYDDNDSKSDVTNDEFNELPSIKTIFRFEINEKCQHKCKLQKCVNYNLCGNMMPQWSLNLGGGYCEDCIISELYELSTQKDDTGNKRRYTI